MRVSVEILPMRALRKRSARSRTLMLVSCERQTRISDARSAEMPYVGHEHALACSIPAQDAATSETTVLTSDWMTSVTST